MSHFSVLITLPAGTPPECIEDEISRRMEPWDEGRRVEPYRSYEDGGAGDYWWVAAMQRGAQELREGAPSKVRYDEICKWWSVGGSYHFDTEAEARQYERDDREDDARWADRIGEHPTWETVVTLYNEKYGHDKAQAAEGDESDPETLHYDPETGRAYTWSTYNPESKWDYWRIGGRWWGYFLMKERGPGLLCARRDWDAPRYKIGDDRKCDGGPKRYLDFEAMRDEAEVKANAEYDKWDAVCAETPHADSWDHLYGLTTVGEISIDEARRRYNAQPRIAAARKADLGDWDCPVERFMSGREEFVAEQRLAAVPGYALVTLDEQWIAPGRMGWFGMSSEGSGERSGYRHAVNAYLNDKVADDDFVIVLDCHI